MARITRTTAMTRRWRRPTTNTSRPQNNVCIHMNRYKAAVFMLAALLVASCNSPRESAAPAAAGPTASEAKLVRGDKESDSQFAKRVIPPGTEQAFNPVETAVPAPDSIVVL